jgi:CubicO group peptidase (beta-lactamase class C family)
MSTHTTPAWGEHPSRSPLLRLGALATLAVFLATLPLSVLTLRVREEEAPVEVSAPPPPRISPAALDAAEVAVREELERRTFPGAALAVGIGPRVERLTGMGRIGWREGAAPVSPDTTLYDLASLTKAVATTTAVLLLVEEGKIRLDDPVRRHLPEFEGQFKDRVTWRHLLTHTSGLPGGANIRGDTPRERLRRLLRTRIDELPGRYVEYTDLGFVVLWAAAERVAGEPLTRYLERHAWRPLGMHHTRFLPGQECTACAPTLRLSSGEPYRGRPNDLLARRLGGITGNAGLFSTAHDLARFAAMMANGGELGGVRILRPETVREVLRQQPGAGNRTLGWVALCPGEEREEKEPCARPLAVGHNGWTGTSLWIEPELKVWTVIVSNRSYDVRVPRSNQERRMQALREEVLRRAAGLPDPPDRSGG